MILHFDKDTLVQNYVTPSDSHFDSEIVNLLHCLLSVKSNIEQIADGFEEMVAVIPYTS
jgi:hypothetical protein